CYADAQRVVGGKRGNETNSIERKEVFVSRIIESGNHQIAPSTPYVPPSLEPINDRIVVQADIVPELTKGGLALPNDAVGRRLSRYGTVLAVGPGALRVFREMRFTGQDEKD